jgi:acyl-CoA thioesterase-1
MNTMTTTLTKGMTILFTGDSITDCGRRAGPFTPMGNGYARMLSLRLGAKYRELDIAFVNMGISGDRAKDLDARWNRDCIKLRPSLVSVLIGVNDTWRRFDHNDPTSTDEFTESYRRILEKTKRETEAALVLCEPFLLHCGQVTDEWRSDLDPKIESVRKLAGEFSAILVPLDDVFARASVETSPSFLAEDGVHPTEAGHALIARTWLKYVFNIELP